MRLFPFLCKRRQFVYPFNYTISDITKKYANLPEAYIKDVMERVYWETPKRINYLPKKFTADHPVLGVERPWDIQSDQNTDRKYEFVEPIRDWLFFRGDRVMILEGKDKGKQGNISMVIPERNWVIVHGLNADMEDMKVDNVSVSCHLTERPLLVTTQVTHVDPGDLLPTKAEWAYTEDGEKVRISSRTGRIIPLSKLNDATYDYTLKQAYKENSKDTKPEDMEATYVPSLETFEMDIAEEQGIVEERIPAKSYWY